MVNLLIQAFGQSKPMAFRGVEVKVCSFTFQPFLAGKKLFILHVLTISQHLDAKSSSAASVTQVFAHWVSIYG